MCKAVGPPDEGPPLRHPRPALGHRRQTPGGDGAPGRRCETPPESLPRPGQGGRPAAGCGCRRVGVCPTRPRGHIPINTSSAHQTCAIAVPPACACTHTHTCTPTYTCTGSHTHACHMCARCSHARTRENLQAPNEQSNSTESARHVSGRRGCWDQLSLTAARSPLARAGTSCLRVSRGLSEPRKPGQEVFLKEFYCIKKKKKATFFCKASSLISIQGLPLNAPGLSAKDFMTDLPLI